MGDYAQTIGVTFPVGADGSYEQVVGRVFGVDSTGTYHTRVQTFVQRPALSPIGDITGKIYGDGVYDGAAVTLSKVEYAISLLDAFHEVAALTADPEYSFPAAAVSAGAAFKIPISPPEYASSVLWIRLTVNFTGTGDSLDTGGPFVWAPPDTSLNPPVSITVPVHSSTGDMTISWALVVGATGYKLQEATESDFSDATEIYDGAAAFSLPMGRAEGVYYYRVLAYNVGNTSGWRTGDNGCQVEFDTLKISPDLGWDSRNDVVDPFKNPNIVRVDPGDLVLSSMTPNGYVGPNRRVVAVGGLNKDIPLAAIRGLLADKQTHYYQFGYLGTIGEFMLLLDAPPVEEEEDL